MNGQFENAFTHNRLVANPATPANPTTPAAPDILELFEQISKRCRDKDDCFGCSTSRFCEANNVDPWAWDFSTSTDPAPLNYRDEVRVKGRDSSITAVVISKHPNEHGEVLVACEGLGKSWCRPDELERVETM